MATQGEIRAIAISVVVILAIGGIMVFFFGRQIITFILTLISTLVGLF